MSSLGEFNQQKSERQRLTSFSALSLRYIQIRHPQLEMAYNVQWGIFAQEYGLGVSMHTEDFVLVDEERRIIVYKVLRRWDAEVQKLNLDNLIKCPDMDLMHDVVGMMTHIKLEPDRRTQFTPRCYRARPTPRMSSQ